MKKYLMMILVVVAFIFISPLTVSAAAEEEWGAKLDLSDSVSSDIIKLDDGIVVMRYEGLASDNSTLTKYDFKGNKVWSIKNDYGYEIGALVDGFLVSNQTGIITKISNNGKVIWRKEIGAGGIHRLVSFDTGFIYTSGSRVFAFDNNGNLLKEVSVNDIADGGRWNDFAISINNDRSGLLVYYNYSQWLTGRGQEFFHVVKEYSFSLEDKSSSTLAYSGNKDYSIITKIIETDNNYIVTGNYTIVIDKKGAIDKVLNLSMLDIQYIDGYIYAYVATTSENYGVYNTYIGKYDENMNKVAEYQLPVSFENSNNRGTTYTEDLFLNSSAFAALKNKDVFYADDNGVHFILLNSALDQNRTGSIYPYAYPLNYDYGVAQYRLNDKSSDSVTEGDGIINNIFQNPETSSIAVIIVFVIVVLLGGVGFYFGFKRRKANYM